MADWLIVGAGFAGLSAARRLRQLRPTDSIIILDAQEVAQGLSGRNSGFMIDLPHNLAAGEYSPGDVAQSKRETAHNRLAISFARSVAEECGLGKDAFDPVGKINAAASARGEKLNEDFARSLASSAEPFELIDAKAMSELTGTTYYRSGLHTPGAVMIQPAVYIQALADSLRANVDIFENSPVIGLGRQGSLWLAQTPHGQVLAPKVILGVNGFVEQFGHFRGRLMHVHTYASMTSALRQDMNGYGTSGASSWALLPADPMGATIRKISGADGERIVVRTHFTFDPGLKIDRSRIGKVAADQRHSFVARFPHLQHVPFEYSWAGPICLSLNSVPAFGELEEGLFSACCENGLGTVKSTFAGIMAADLATGTQSEQLTEFMAQPLPSKLPPEPFAWLGINSVIRWQELRAGREG